MTAASMHTYREAARMVAMTAYRMARRGDGMGTWGSWGRVPVWGTATIIAAPSNSCPTTFSGCNLNLFYRSDQGIGVEYRQEKRRNEGVKSGLGYADKSQPGRGRPGSDLRQPDVAGDQARTAPRQRDRLRLPGSRRQGVQRLPGGSGGAVPPRGRPARPGRPGAAPAHRDGRHPLLDSRDVGARSLSRTTTQEGGARGGGPFRELEGSRRSVRPRGVLAALVILDRTLLHLRLAELVPALDVHERGVVAGRRGEADTPDAEQDHVRAAVGVVVDLDVVGVHRLHALDVPLVVRSAAGQQEQGQGRRTSDRCDLPHSVHALLFPLTCFNSTAIKRS